MAQNKTKPTNKNPLEFIDAIPNEGLKKDARVVMKKMEKITGHKPVMWGPAIIGFGHFVLTYESGRETELPLISFSPRKQQLVLYILNNSLKQKELLKNLGKHSTGKVCLYIKRLSDINIDVLEEIIDSSFKKAIER